MFDSLKGRYGQHNAPTAPFKKSFSSLRKKKNDCHPVHINYKQTRAQTYDADRAVQTVYSTPVTELRGTPISWE